MVLSVGRRVLSGGGRAGGWFGRWCGGGRQAGGGVRAGLARLVCCGGSGSDEGG